jgi:hypothetical protein
MNRPAYETESDRSRELAVALHVAEPRLMTPHRTPRYYPCDWLFQPQADSSGNREHWLAEIKVRDATYSSYMLSLHKAAQLLTMGVAGGFMPVLIVAWLDRGEVGLCELRTGILRPGYGGRKDRGDKQDMEPVVLVARKHFLVERFSPALSAALSPQETEQSSHAR